MFQKRRPKDLVSTFRRNWGDLLLGGVSDFSDVVLSFVDTLMTLMVVM